MTSVKLQWIILIFDLPARQSNARVKFWRQFKKVGAVAIGNSTYILPFNKDTYESFLWLSKQIKDAGGVATLFTADDIHNMSHAEIVSLFNRERDNDYLSILKEVKNFRQRLEKIIRLRKGEEYLSLEGNLCKLERQISGVKEIDFFGASKGVAVQSQLKFSQTSLTKLLQLVKMGENTEMKKKPLNKKDFQGKRWMTRPRPHIDRLATAWFIRKFIDAKAKFIFANEVADAPHIICFDMKGGEFTHQGEWCTLEVFRQRFGLQDNLLEEIAEIVHDADLRDDKFCRPEWPGIDLILRGWEASIQDDYELLKKGMSLFDDLYASLGRKKKH